MSTVLGEQPAFHVLYRNRPRAGHLIPDPALHHPLVAVYEFQFGQPQQNTRETSRMLIPSTITARRTRRYTSTWYIHPTTHKHDFEPMNGGGRYIFQPPQVRRSIRPGGPL